MVKVREKMKEDLPSEDKDRIDLSKDGQLLSVLSSERKIEILKKVFLDKYSLTELAEEFGISSAGVRKHVEALEKAGLVRKRKNEESSDASKVIEPAAKLFSPLFSQHIKLPFAEDIPDFRKGTDLLNGYREKIGFFNSEVSERRLNQWISTLRIREEDKIKEISFEEKKGTILGFFGIPSGKGITQEIGAWVGEKIKEWEAKNKIRKVEKGESTHRRGKNIVFPHIKDEYKYQDWKPLDPPFWISPFKEEEGFVFPFPWTGSSEWDTENWDLNKARLIADMSDWFDYIKPTLTTGLSILLFYEKQVVLDDLFRFKYYNLEKNLENSDTPIATEALNELEKLRGEILEPNKVVLEAWKNTYKKSTQILNDQLKKWENMRKEPSRFTISKLETEEGQNKLIARIKVLKKFLNDLKKVEGTFPFLKKLRES